MIDSIAFLVQELQDTQRAMSVQLTFLHQPFGIHWTDHPHVLTPGSLIHSFIIIFLFLL
jgi:hypothetical protein